MHKIGIISDTHGLLRPEVVKALEGCEAILHGGDFDTEEIMDALEEIAPVYAVRGNNDYWAEAEVCSLSHHSKSGSLSENLSVELYGVRFFMTHNKKRIPKDIADFDVIVYGHSHKYDETYAGRQLMLNPGSCGPKRFTLPITLALMEITGEGSFSVERIDLEKPDNRETGIKESKGFDRKRKHSLDTKQIIELVVKDTKKGIAVEKIAHRHGISQKLAEQICRLYLTHPGVDTDGIMRKMGL